MAVTHPDTTPAVVWHAPGDLRVDVVPVPRPGAGEVLLRITACGLCPGEIMDWYMARKAPVPLGHEAVGEVVEAGRGARFRVGDRVFVHHHAPCLACRACDRGQYVQCPTWRPRRLIPGGLSAYALAQEQAVSSDALLIPSSMSDEIATFIEPLACVVKSLRRSGTRPGDRVLVVGAGVMGLLHLMALRAAHQPALLIGSDRVADRCAVARRYADQVVDASQRGLADAVREMTNGEGVDVAVVGPGAVDALDAGLASLAAGGTLVVFTPTPPGDRWPLDVQDVFFREVSVVPSYSAGPDDTREAVRVLLAGLPVADLISHRLRLADAAAGYELIRSTAALKVIVAP